MYICNSFYKLYIVRYTTQKSEKFDSQYNSHFDNHTHISVFAKEKMTQNITMEKVTFYSNAII